MTPARPLFNPFPGLRPFTSAERHLFFGRETQTAELLARLQRFRFLAAVGPSGSGKSSLVRAGMLPELYGGTLRPAGTHWRVALMRPGGTPLQHLAAALIEGGLFESEDADTVEIVRTALERSSLGLADAVRKSQLTPGENLLVVVDQFEELFRFRRRSADTADAGKAFVDLLLEATRQPDLPIYVVITMRSDFLGDCARFRGLAEAINESEYLIPRLTREQWKLAIEGPVRVGGGTIAPRLTQRLLKDVADDPDQLPTLQHALMRTWDRWVATGNTSRPLDLEDYEAVGGLAEALSRHADETHDALPDDPHRRVAERVFRALTDLAADSRGVRRPTRFAELVAIVAAPEEQVRRVLEAFSADGRGFLTPSTGIDADTVIDIAHESLMRIWRRLRGWAGAEAQSSQMFLRLADAAARWKAGQVGLYRDPELELALKWRAANEPSPAWAEHLGAALDPVVGFLEAGRSARTAEAEAQAAARRRELEQAQQLAEAERRRAEIEARSATRMRRLAFAMVLLAAAAIVAGLWARHLGQLARTRELSVSATQQLDLDPELSVLLAREAHRLNPIPLAARTLQSALLASKVRAALRPGGPESLDADDDSRPQFRRVVYSPDGSVVAAHSLTIGSTNEGRLWLWRPFGSDTNVPCGYGELKSMSFTPDSRFLFTAGGDGRVRIWDVASATAVAMQDVKPNPLRPSDPLGEADLSEDGRRVVTVGGVGQVRLWDWRANTTLAEWTDPGAKDVRFHPDEQSVVTVTDLGEIKFWRRGLTAPFREFSAPGQFSVRKSLSISRDGHWLAVTGANGRVALFDCFGGLSGRLVLTNSPLSRFTAVEFSPTADALVMTGTSATEIWRLSPDLGDGSQWTKVARIAADSQVLKAVFSPDGHWVCTALANNSLRLWSVETGAEAAAFRGHRRQVNDVAFSPDGKFVVSASHDGTVRLWEVEASLGKLVRVPELRERLEAAATDGRRALIRSDEAPWQIWAEGAGSPIGVAGLPADLPGAAFSPDGGLLATIEGAEVRLRDASTGEVLRRLSWNSGGGNPEKAARPGELKPVVIEFSGDGKWLAGAGDVGEIVLWRVSDRGETGPRRHGRDSDPARLALSRDGEVIVVARLDYTLEVWRGSQATPVVLTNRMRIGSIAIDPAGELIAAGLSDGSIRLWRSDPKSPPAELRGHTLQVNCLDWSRDGRILASGSADGTIQLWAMDRSAGAGGRVSADRLGALQGFAGRHDESSDWTIKTVAFGQDGTSLVATSSSGEVRRFELPELAATADLQGLTTKQRLTRDFSAEEALRYGIH